MATFGGDAIRRRRNEMQALDQPGDVDQSNIGWLDWGSYGRDLPFYQGSVQGGDQRVDPDALAAWLDQNQYRLWQEFGPRNADIRWLEDSSGNKLIQPRDYATNDRTAAILGMLALGGAGGSAIAGSAGAASGTTAAQAAMMNPEVYGLAAQTGLGGAGAAGAAAGAGGAAAGAGGAAGAAGGAGSVAGGTAAGNTAAAGGGGMGSLWGEIASSLIGSAIQAKASKDAAEDMRAGTEAGIAEQRRQYDTTRADFTPWRETGQRALGSLEQDISRMPTAEEVMAEPGYQFGMDEGMKAIDRRLAAIGGRRGGAAAKAGARFATNYASSQYGAAYQRRQDRLNRLAALAGIGQTATVASAAAGANATNAITGLIAGQGDANAAQRLYQGNIWGNAANEFGAAWLRRNQGTKSTQPVYGATWQQQGGPMDQDAYSEYGYYGGP